MDTHKVTAKFQLQFLSILHPLDSSLAAHIGARIRSSDNALHYSPLHCERCGHLAVSSRIVRKSLSNNKQSSKQRSQNELPDGQRTASRSIRRTCTRCGHVEYRACPPSPRKTDRRSVTTTPSVIEIEERQMSDSPAQHTESISTAVVHHPEADSKPISREQEQQKKDDKSSRRQKKKAGLQEMLAKEKERRKEREDQARGGGLAAFLTGL